MNSVRSTSPEPSRSKSWMSASTSESSTVSPRSFIRCRTSCAEIWPLPSVSTSLKICAACHVLRGECGRRRASRCHELRKAPAHCKACKGAHCYASVSPHGRTSEKATTSL